MHSFAFHEKEEHGSLDFPVEYHYINQEHPRYNMPYHWHKEWELIRIKKGTFSILVENQEFHAVAGDILLISSGMLHGGYPSDCVYECLLFDLHALYRNIDFTKSHLRPFYRNQFQPHIFFPGYHTEFYPVTDELFSSFQTPFFELVTLSNITRLFTILLQNHAYTEIESDVPDHSKRIRQIMPVMEYIEAHFQEHITVPMLADVIGMSPKYFNRFFHSITHQTPIDYVNYYRIEQAANILSSTENSITEIGQDCGFCDSSHFIKTFKRYKDMTPLQYRKKNSV